MKKESINKIFAIVGETALLGVLGVGAFVVLNKPDEVTNPSWRTTHRSDGTPKKPFNSALAANWQAVKQFFMHGELCNPYQVGDKYYTGHKK